MGEPELEVGVARLDALICQPVATQQRHQGAGGGAQVTLSRRPLAANVALVGNDRRLVDRPPEAGQLAQLVRDPFRVTGESLGGLGRFPTAGVGNPGRIREMVQRDHRLHTAIAERLQHVRVVPETRPGKLAGRRLDPTPFKRQSVRVLMQAFKQVEVAREAPVVIASRIRAIAVLDMPGRLLPGPPVVAVIAAFDLVCRGGGAPVKALRKRSGAHRAGGGWVMMAKTTARITSARTRTTTTPMGPTTAATARPAGRPQRRPAASTTKAFFHRKIARPSRPRS